MLKMICMRFVIPVALGILTFALPTSCDAALIAEYNFDNGLNNSASGLYSPLTVIGSAPVLGGHSYHSDGNNANYLEIAPAVGGAPTYTVSVWV